MRLSFFTSIAALAGLVFLLPVAGAQAQTTFFATGFESGEGYSTTAGAGPATVTVGGLPYNIQRAGGALFGQPNPEAYTFFVQGQASGTANQIIERSINSTRVVNNAASGGSQSVLMDGTVKEDQSLLYIPSLPALTAGANSSITVSADVRVFNRNNAGFGQWGMNLLELTGNTLRTVAAYGFVNGNIIATNDSTSLYAALDLNTFAPITASYDTFNSYALQMDYANRTISGFFNGSQVGFVRVDAFGNPLDLPILSMPFRAEAGNTLSWTGFGEAMDLGTTESANFDNVRIVGTNVAAVVPEPGTLTLLVLGAIGSVAPLLTRRRHSGDSK